MLPGHVSLAHGSNLSLQHFNSDLLGWTISKQWKTLPKPYEISLQISVRNFINRKNLNACPNINTFIRSLMPLITLIFIFSPSSHSPVCKIKELTTYIHIWLLLWAYPLFYRSLPPPTPLALCLDPTSLFYAPGFFPGWIMFNCE